MKRSIKSIEYEIINQILIIELCFNICDSIEKIPGRGKDFLPFYYNLNFTKGLNSLHSLLLSTLKSEISIDNYKKEYKKEFPSDDIDKFIESINKISDEFSKIFPIPLRHKITAHIDESFFHYEFTSAYILPNLIDKYKKIIEDLKKVYFKFTNYSLDNNLNNINEQSNKILSIIM